MSNEAKKPCDLCAAQVKKSRHEPAHAHLKLIESGGAYKHMFGGGQDTWWRCDQCGSTLFHSTDRYDFGWQLDK